MTPHQIELVKKLDQEVQNLSILMQHTEVGDSLTLKDIRHCLYLLNKEVKEQEPTFATLDWAESLSQYTIEERIELNDQQKEKLGRFLNSQFFADLLKATNPNLFPEPDQPQPKGLKLDGNGPFCGTLPPNPNFNSCNPNHKP